MIKITKPSPVPTGWKRFLFRAPLLLYRLGLGWLLGKRFLLITHRGRKSGLPRKSVLEIVNIEGSTGNYHIASGFGKRAQWYQNLIADPNVTIQVGLREILVRAVPLAPDDSGEMMVQYAERNPTAAKSLTRLIGYQVDGTEEDYRTIGREVIPFFTLVPRLATAQQAQ